MADNSQTTDMRLFTDGQEHGLIRPRQEAVVYVVIGYQGEWSSLQVWVAGAFTDKDAAITQVEAQKRQDRAHWAIWCEWSKEFGRRIAARKDVVWWPPTASFKGMSREDSTKLVDMYPEPPHGGDETEYTVAVVPLNQMGRWDYA
jgi:hypothetical protein